MSADVLTVAELAAVQQAADLWGTLCKVVGNGPTRNHDLAELAAHIHAIQHAVMSQAAARIYPDLYRLLGESRPEQDVTA
jgi:hypothetical protein